MKGLAPSSVVGLLVALIVLAVFVSLLMMSPELRRKIEEAISFMGQQLGVEDPYKGRALHVKISSTYDKIWEFHLTIERKHYSDESRYFLIDDWYDRCVIFQTTEYEKYADQGWIDYVNPGARIQEGCGKNIGECIKDFVDPGYSGCNPDCCSGCDCYGKFKFVSCESRPCTAECDEVVKSAEFGTKMQNKCYTDEKGGGCPLLKPEGEYTVLHGLICGDDRYWHACAESKKGQKIFAGGRNFECVYDQDKEVWLWNLTAPCTPEGSVKPGTECMVCTNGLYIPNDAKCEEVKGPGYRCDKTTGNCTLEVIPLSEVVWMIGEGTCEAPSDWKMYILTNGTFITDFRKAPCENREKCAPNNKAIVHNSTWIGINELIMAAEKFPPTIVTPYNYGCLGQDIVCNGCHTIFETQSKNGRIKSISKSCKELNVTGFKKEILPGCPIIIQPILQPIPQYFYIIKSGDFIKIRQSDKIEIQKLCEAGQILAGTECRVCNNQTVPFIDNNTKCPANKPFCVKGMCEEKLCRPLFDIKPGTECTLCNATGTGWEDSDWYCVEARLGRKCVNGKCIY
jgi:hypothetical protein